MCHTSKTSTLAARTTIYSAWHVRAYVAQVRGTSNAHLDDGSPSVWRGFDDDCGVTPFCSLIPCLSLCGPPGVELASFVAQTRENAPVPDLVSTDRCMEVLVFFLSCWSGLSGEFCTRTSSLLASGALTYDVQSARSAKWIKFNWSHLFRLSTAPSPTLEFNRLSPIWPVLLWSGRLRPVLLWSNYVSSCVFHQFLHMLCCFFFCF